MPYLYDVFISYKRNSDAGLWVRNHLYPVLTQCLASEMPRDPQVWFDEDQDIGTNWPNNLKHVLLHSRVILCVWSPPYFRSAWCLAEWESMRAREQIFRHRGNTNPPVIYPVIFSDGEHFPQSAREIIGRTDLSAWGYPYLQFRNSLKYLAFHDAVRTVAIELAKRVSDVPPWEPGWPTLNPAALPEPMLQLPRL